MSVIQFAYGKAPLRAPSSAIIIIITAISIITAIIITATTTGAATTTTKMRRDESRRDKRDETRRDKTRRDETRRDETRHMRAHIRSSNSALTTTGVCTIVRYTCYILQILNFELYEHIQCAKLCIFMNLN